MLRPTPRLPTASVVDGVFAKLSIEDKAIDGESIGEDFDLDSLTDAELIEAHCLGLIDLEDTGPHASGGHGVSSKGVASTKRRSTTFPSTGPASKWGGVSRYATDNQHPFKRLLDYFGITVPGIDSPVPQRDYGLRGFGDYSPPKSSSITGDGDIALTYAERVVTRIFSLLEMVKMDTARFGAMTPNAIIFSSRFGVVTASSMVAALALMDKLYLQHLELWKREVSTARATRASTTFDTEERVGRSRGRGVSYAAKVDGKKQNYTAFEHAVRWSAVHPEVWSTLDAELKAEGMPGIFRADGSILP